MNGFTIVPVAQRSPDWIAARLGRLTGSCAGEMLAKTKTGEAAGRRNLRLRLVLERLTGRSHERDYVTPAMQDGIDREDAAIAAYEALTGAVVRRTGFLVHPVHMAGCSLDGHLGDFTALVSIKCRQPAAHLACLQAGTIPAEALAQIRHELWITGAETADYFSWSPDFPEPLQARLVTVTRPEADVTGYERAALAFLTEVDAEYQSVLTMLNPAQVCRQVVAAGG